MTPAEVNDLLDAAAKVFLRCLAMACSHIRQGSR